MLLTGIGSQLNSINICLRRDIIIIHSLRVLNHVKCHCNITVGNGGLSSVKVVDWGQSFCHEVGVYCVDTHKAILTDSKMLENLKS